MIRSFLLTCVCCIFISLFLKGQRDTLLLTFDIGKTELTKEHKSLLAELVNTYTQRDSITIDLTGSADYLGNISANQIISDRRIQSVKKYFLEDSVARQWPVMATSLGEVNSHLEEQLGREGVLSDRSVRLDIQVF